MQSVMMVGSEGIIIEIECQLSNGLPSIIIVGLGNKAIDEAKERIRSAFVSTGLKLPRKRIIVNLAPADIPKESTGLDLAMATAILHANGQCKRKLGSSHGMIGELGLNGDVRPVRGIIGKLITGKSLGIDTFFIPAGNLPQAGLVPGLQLIPIQTLRQMFSYLHDETILPTTHAGIKAPSIVRQTTHNPLSDIAGHQHAKRALEITAAGGHNILLSGPPGTGKSMLAKALAGILPPMSHEEVLEVTHLHSLASSTYDRLILDRPFRAPHHSSSHISIVGGGAQARPGEITLSHRGVLFLDELPEFNRLTIESLRQPLEDKIVSVARAKQSVRYPADFILVATANPCPCGFYGSSKDCQCTPYQIARYQQKLSGPILDRLDLFVTVAEVDHEHILKTHHNTDETQSTLMRVEDARIRQTQRGNFPRLNSSLSSRELKEYAQLHSEASKLLNRAAAHLHLSARSYVSVVKVARTIADLDKSEHILDLHISEALQYRNNISLL